MNSGLEVTNSETFSNLRFLRKFEFFFQKCAIKHFLKLILVLELVFGECAHHEQISSAEISQKC